MMLGDLSAPEQTSGKLIQAGGLDKCREWTALAEWRLKSGPAERCPCSRRSKKFRACRPRPSRTRPHTSGFPCRDRAQVPTNEHTAAAALFIAASAIESADTNTLERIHDDPEVADEVWRVLAALKIV